MFEKFNDRMKKLGYVDVILVKWSVFFATIFIAKLFPKLLNTNFWILALLTIACSARPFYKFWIKKSA